MSSEFLNSIPSAIRPDDKAFLDLRLRGMEGDDNLVRIASALPKAKVAALIYLKGVVTVDGYRLLNSLDRVVALEILIRRSDDADAYQFLSEIVKAESIEEPVIQAAISLLARRAGTVSKEFHDGFGKQDMEKLLLSVIQEASRPLTIRAAAAEAMFRLIEKDALGKLHRHRLLQNTISNPANNFPEGARFDEGKLVDGNACRILHYGNRPETEPVRPFRIRSERSSPSTGKINRPRVPAPALTTTSAYGNHDFRAD